MSGDSVPEAKEALIARFSEFRKYGSKLDRAVDAVLTGGVKEARFLPSGRKVVTVVGSMGDEFVDPEGPYCSCSNFFFRVVGGREEICYHLLGYRIASESGKVDIIKFSDDEYGPYLSATVHDVFEVLRKSSS
jgi:predicted nucleic acid-binding Zn finger protein